MTAQDDLAHWLARIALHDRAAFEALYRATCGHLLGIAFRVSNQRDRAEDVLQESFISVWHRAGSFDASIASPMTWLINIVRNRAIDIQRSHQTERTTTVTLDEEAFEVLADEDSRDVKSRLSDGSEAFNAYLAVKLADFEAASA